MKTIFSVCSGIGSIFRIFPLNMNQRPETATLLPFGLVVYQHAKKVVSDSLGLVDFAIGLVIFVLNLPDGQVFFWGGNSNYRGIVINPANQKGLWG